MHFDCIVDLMKLAKAETITNNTLKRLMQKCKLFQQSSRICNFGNPALIHSRKSSRRFPDPWVAKTSLCFTGVYYLSMTKFTFNGNQCHAGCCCCVCCLTVTHANLCFDALHGWEATLICRGRYWQCPDVVILPSSPVSGRKHCPPNYII